MGFQRKTYRLQFDKDTDYAGLEVRMRGMNFGELEEVAQVQAEGANAMDNIGPMLSILAGAILSWNLEDEDGQPVLWPPLPIVVDGEDRTETGQEARIRALRAEDSKMLFAVIAAWTSQAGDIPAPLDSGSPSGKPLEEAQMPMEIPSSSHPSSNTPS